jgi:hypothetical protein
VSIETDRFRQKTVHQPARPLQRVVVPVGDITSRLQGMQSGGTVVSDIVAGATTRTSVPPIMTISTPTPVPVKSIPEPPPSSVLRPVWARSGVAAPPVAIGTNAPQVADITPAPIPQAVYAASTPNLDFTTAATVDSAVKDPAAMHVAVTRLPQPIHEFVAPPIDQVFADQSINEPVLELSSKAALRIFERFHLLEMIAWGEARLMLLNKRTTYSASIVVSVLLISGVSYALFKPSASAAANATTGSASIAAADSSPLSIGSQTSSGTSATYASSAATTLSAAPTFSPAVPEDKPQLATNGTFDASLGSYEYNDDFLTQTVAITEQQVVASTTASAAVSAAAASALATQQIQLNSGTAYMATDTTSGAQVIVFSTKGLLIYVRSSVSHDAATWQPFLNTFI